MVGLVSVWRWVSMWAEHHFPAIPMAAVWAVVAVVVICFGWWLQERLYRTVGWVLLIIALLRALLLDLHSGRDFRLGLLAIGAALLVISFSYFRRPSHAGE